MPHAFEVGSWGGFRVQSSRFGRGLAGTEPGPEIDTGQTTRPSFS